MTFLVCWTYLFSYWVQVPVCAELIGNISKRGVVGNCESESAPTPYY